MLCWGHCVGFGFAGVEMIFFLAMVALHKNSCTFVLQCTVLGCEQKSIEVEYRWSNLRVCNANYAAEQAIDVKFW